MLYEYPECIFISAQLGFTIFPRKKRNVQMTWTMEHGIMKHSQIKATPHAHEQELQHHVTASNSTIHSVPKSPLANWQLSLHYLNIHSKF